MTSRRAVGGTALLLAGVLYLLAETIAASAWVRPAYSYALNYISDLGAIGCPVEYQGRTVCSPLHAVMNAGFALEGVLVVAAAVLLVPLAHGGGRWLVLVLAVVHSAGIVTVAIVPETALSPLHAGGATCAIVGGNLAIVTSGIVLRRHPLGVAAIMLGIVGIVGAVLLETSSVAPDGVLERVSVYTLTTFEIVGGLTLLVRRPRQWRIA